MPLGYTMGQPQGNDLSERLSEALKRFFALMSERGGRIESRMRDTTMPQRPLPQGLGAPDTPATSTGGAGLPEEYQQPDPNVNLEMMLTGTGEPPPRMTPSQGRGIMEFSRSRDGQPLEFLLAEAGRLGSGGGFSQSNPIERWSYGSDGSRRKVYGDDARAQDSAIRQQMAADSLASAASYWETLAMQTGNPRHILAARQASEAYNQYIQAKAQEEYYGGRGNEMSPEIQMLLSRVLDQQG